ncbi:MAG: chemotaxis protein CheX [Leptospiraceae bacterium]|nr:chemotaxis protein CheX [Leptospiraceae bacterium]
MKAELINPFLDATIAVFRMMLKTELVRGRTLLRTSPMPAHDIAIFIDLMGQYHGQVVYSMNSETVHRIVERLIPGIPAGDVEEEYRDVIGEIGNMITGNALQAFVQSNAEMNLDVPIVVDVRKQRPPVMNVSTLGWNLYSCLGLVEVNVAVTEKKKARGS